jgi:hypothetical protein
VENYKLIGEGLALFGVVIVIVIVLRRANARK